MGVQRGNGGGLLHPPATPFRSGPTAFANANNSYLIPVEDSTDSRGYCRPIVPALVELLREVVAHPQEAAAVGARAREHMIERFSPERVAGLISDRMAHLAAHGGVVD